MPELDLEDDAYGAFNTVVILLLLAAGYLTYYYFKARPAPGMTFIFM